jgi:hypothetical protein
MLVARILSRGGLRTPAPPAGNSVGRRAAGKEEGSVHTPLAATFTAAGVYDCLCASSRVMIAHISGVFVALSEPGTRCGPLLHTRIALICDIGVNTEPGPPHRNHSSAVSLPPASWKPAARARSTSAG